MTSIALVLTLERALIRALIWATRLRDQLIAGAGSLDRGFANFLGEVVVFAVHLGSEVVDPGIYVRDLLNRIGFSG